MTDPEDIDRSASLDPDVRDLEAPAADAAEQATLADPALEELEPTQRLEVSDWDAVEQARVVDLDDDYR
jgi:hypothetical protein